TIVKPCWLSALLDTFAEAPRAGIVGSKLVYPDGRLQEAGGIIWRDASGWNYGKFDDSGKPEYNYLREVDYGSAAVLMISKSLIQAPPGKKNILIIDHHLPMPDKDSGSVRMFNILNILRGLGHRVTFMPDNLADIPPYGAELRKRGIEVVHYPYIKKMRDYLI